MVVDWCWLLLRACLLVVRLFLFSYWLYVLIYLRVGLVLFGLLFVWFVVCDSFVCLLRLFYFFSLCWFVLFDLLVGWLVTTWLFSLGYCLTLLYVLWFWYLYGVLLYVLNWIVLFDGLLLWGLFVCLWFCVWLLLGSYSFEVFAGIIVWGWGVLVYFRWALSCRVLVAGVNCWLFCFVGALLFGRLWGFAFIVLGFCLLVYSPCVVFVVLLFWIVVDYVLI